MATPSGPLAAASSPIMFEPYASCIYNMELVATGSNATLAVYDVSTLAYLSPVIEYVSPIYELSVSTSGGVQTVDFGNAPLRIFNGLAIQVTNGTAYLNYE